MTPQQTAALDYLRSVSRRGVNTTELARALGTTENGAARTASSLYRLGLVDRFVGGVGYRPRRYWQAIPTDRPRRAARGPKT